MTNTIKTKLLRKTICRKEYYAQRMDAMNREAAYYVNLANSAHNSILHNAYLNVADVYLKRGQYYFRKNTL